MVFGAVRRIFRLSKLFSVRYLPTEIRAIHKNVDVAAWEFLQEVVLRLFDKTGISNHSRVFSILMKNAALLSKAKQRDFH